MRTRIKFIALIAALAAAAGACGTAQPAASLEPAASAQTTTVAETTTTTTTTTAEATASSAAEPPTPADVPDKLYIDEFVDERFRDKIEKFKAQTDNFMNTNKFIDYRFINGPEPSDIPADVQERAVKCCAESEQCRESAKNIDILSDPELHITYEGSDGSDINTFISDGTIVPKFVAGWENDFDGDGKPERFLAVQYPFLYPQNPVFFPTQLIFENSSGEMSVVDQVDILRDDKAVMLDYGHFKQFLLSGNGYWGASEHSTLFGVIDGECKELISGRIWFHKQGCFLSFSGWQDYSRFMIYDTTENRYREITGYPADIDKLKQYDKDDIIIPTLPDPESEIYLYYVIGGRYFLDTGSFGHYKYETGNFVSCEAESSDYIEIYPMWKKVGDEDWFDVDVDAALEKSGSSMAQNE